MIEQLMTNSLKSARRIYSNFFPKPPLVPAPCISDADEVSALIYNRLLRDEQLMIARFGNTEITCVLNYLGTITKERSAWNYITGKQKEWWWQPKIVKQIHTHAGFFPPTIEKVSQFSKLILQDLSLVDILASWLSEERYFENEMEHTIKIDFELLNPYFSKKPWTWALENKKVLVVHPFAETIASQYQKRSLLFENNVLPAFDLKTIKAVQSLAGQQTNFADWFEALDYMKAEIDKVDYDICLIGAGAYGFSLAAHVKRSGKKAVHMGGCLQLLFGIRGKRWEDPAYNPKYNFVQFMNEHWVKPATSETPTNAQNVEGACYW